MGSSVQWVQSFSYTRLVSSRDLDYNIVPILNTRDALNNLLKEQISCIQGYPPQPENYYSGGKNEIMSLKHEILLLQVNRFIQKMKQFKNKQTPAEDYSAYSYAIPSIFYGTREKKYKITVSLAMINSEAPSWEVFNKKFISNYAVRVKSNQAMPSD